MIEVRRAAERFRTEQPGITTWHAFSSGPHYDPGNVSFGAVVACDEHEVAPGAGFARHRHARVELVSWVLEGALRHEDASGQVRTIEPGTVQYQRAGTGIEHAETNASATEPLRFVQLWLTSDVDGPSYEAAAPPQPLDAGSFEVWRGGALPPAPARYLVVASGRVTVGEHDVGAGDSIRITAETPPVSGAGELLVVLLSKP